MPTYDYKCESCDCQFEQFQRMTDDPLENCPKCEGPVKRLIGTGAGIIFKGKGFYQTDYKNSGSKKEDKPGKDKGPAACGKSPGCSGCEQNV